MKSAVAWYLLGIFFGAVLFVLVTGGLLPIATPAGFSERWAQDTIVRTLPGPPESAEPQLTEVGKGKDEPVTGGR